MCDKRISKSLYFMNSEHRFDKAMDMHKLCQFNTIRFISGIKGVEELQMNFGRTCGNRSFNANGQA